MEEKNNLFEEVNQKLNSFLQAWDTFTLLKKEALIEFYWSLALNEKDILINILKSDRRTRYASHLDFLYLYTYMALGLCLKHIKEWEILKEELKEIAVLFLNFRKRKYVNELFKQIANNRKIGKLLLEWGISNKPAIENKKCSYCGKVIEISKYKNHRRNCYYLSVKKKKKV